MVTFNVPAITVSDFYGENLIENLAAFLNISPDRIRVVELSEQGRRKKRASDMMEVMTDSIIRQRAIYRNIKYVKCDVDLG